MIAVDRDVVDVPAALDGDESLGAVELAKAETFFRQARNREESFPFRAYKHKTVKAALRVLFHGKCAYCESFYAGSQPPDIEHFRPKGGFIDDEGQLAKPGYWWLAAAWENLLPSCIDCNRSRQHAVDGEDVAFGKENLFPVAGVRALRPADALDRENRLLVDPCRDDPRRFFFYKDEGVIVPETGAGAPERAMAEASKKTFGLGRPDLTLARKGHQLTVIEQIRVAKDYFESLRDDTGSSAKRRKSADALAGMLRHRDAASEYAALARQYIDPKLPGIRKFLERELGHELRVEDGHDPDVLVAFVAAFATPEEKRTSDPGEFDLA